MESIRKKHRSHRYCSVPGCKARSSNDISLFLFPKSIELAKKWAEILSIHDRVAKYNYVCSLHFRRNDFTVSTSANKRRLKMGAIPSKNLPISSNGIQLPQFIDKDTKWEQKISVRKMFNETNLFECRGCLQPCSNEEKHDLFKSWHPPWPGMENTLAEDLSKLACIQIMKNDPHSKVLCESCFKHLQNACQFVEIVKKADEVLNLRMDNNTESWPKPIQIDKNVPFENVEIKNEILSDNEGQINEDFSNVDVKIEADDWPSQQVHINGTISLSSLNKEMNQVNGKNEHFNNERNANKLISENETFDINNSNVTVKSEPLSDVEENDDLTMDCILCSKTFLSITGLKAHVIANHTYKTVRRKGLDEIDEMKLDYACDVCQRRFETSTDLMVHKTCHNKCICSGCSLAFETIDHLSQHRLFCKALKDREVGKVLKLEDVQRNITCPHCSDTFPDSTNLNLHLDVCHPYSDPYSDDTESDVLESILGK